MWWDLKIFRPEPLLGNVLKLNITYQCSAMFVKPKQKPNSELNANWASVSHHIAKRIVVRSTELVFYSIFFVVKTTFGFIVIKFGFTV
jgi:hypothetical protein